MKAIKQININFFIDEETIFLYANTLDFNKWGKKQLRALLSNGDTLEAIPPASKKKSAHKEVLGLKGLAFYDCDKDLLALENLNRPSVATFIKRHLQIEIESYAKIEDAIYKKCLICGKLFNGIKLTCSPECQKIHYRQLQVKAENKRDQTDERKQYLKEYAKKYNKDYYKKRKMNLGK